MICVRKVGSLSNHRVEECGGTTSLISKRVGGTYADGRSSEPVPSYSESDSHNPNPGDLLPMHQAEEVAHFPR